MWQQCVITFRSAKLWNMSGKNILKLRNYIRYFRMIMWLINGVRVGSEG